MNESVAKVVLPLLVLLGGLFTGVMVAANGRLKDAVQSPALTVALAFAIGSAVMFLVAATGLTGKNDWSRALQTPWWAWIGGILSVFAVMFIVIANAQGSAAFILAAGVVGQQVVALALAHFGWLGTEKEPINGYKIGGFVLLVAGALLMGKK